MSLRSDYAQTAPSTAGRRLVSVSKTLLHDLSVVRDCLNTRGLSATFALLKSTMMAGQWSRKDSTLSYTLAQEDVPLEHINYTRILADIRKNNRDWMPVECKSAAMDEIISRRLPRAQSHIAATVMNRHERALEASAAFADIHELCASPVVDMKTELRVAATGNGGRARESVDFYIDLDGTVVARPRLQLCVSLDQPYEAPKPVTLQSPSRSRLG